MDSLIQTVRGVLSAEVPNSSFAEAHKVLLSEPTHVEDEDRENERKMRETVKSAKWRVEERSEQTLRKKHG